MKRIFSVLLITAFMTTLLGLRTAIYPTPNLKEAKAWYSQVLEMKPYFDEPFYVGFSVAGFELGLIPDGVASTSGPQPLWGMSDIHSVHQRLIQLGAKPLDPITDVGGEIQVAAVVEPFGNRLGLIQNPNS